MDDDVLIIELRAVGAGPPAPIRFRRALKSLLRRHGLRATLAPGTATPPPARRTRAKPDGAAELAAWIDSTKPRAAGQTPGG